MEFYIAEMDTEKYNFKGVGADPLSALTALEAALKEHAKYAKLEDRWWDEYDFNMHHYKNGSGYRDNKEVTHAPTRQEILDGRKTEAHH